MKKRAKIVGVSTGQYLKKFLTPSGLLQTGVVPWWTMEKSKFAGWHCAICVIVQHIVLACLVCSPVPTVAVFQNDGSVTTTTTVVTCLMSRHIAVSLLLNQLSISGRLEFICEISCSSSRWVCLMNFFNFSCNANYNYFCIYCIYASMSAIISLE